MFASTFLILFTIPNNLPEQSRWLKMAVELKQQITDGNFMSVGNAIEGKESGFVNYSLLADSDAHKANVHYAQTASSDFKTHDHAKAFYLNAYNVLCMQHALKRIQANPNWSGNTGLVKRAKFFGMSRPQHLMWSVRRL